MIFFLDNGDKFILYLGHVDVVFAIFSGITDKPLKQSVRWHSINIFDDGHIKDIYKYLKSEDENTKKIGKAFLEETLKVRIHGNISHHIESKR